MYRALGWLPIAFAALVAPGPAQAQEAGSGAPPSGAADAEGFRFSVAIDAPRPIRQMLEPGLDIVRWPASSFMLGDTTWTRNGVILAVVGIVLLWFARKK